MDAQNINVKAFENMQLGEPVARYKKACLGKVQVRILNPYHLIPELLILQGDANSGADGAFYSAWSEQERVYFENSNKYHFKVGNMVTYNKPAKEDEKAKNYNALTDEEIVGLLESKYFTLKYALEQMSTPTVLIRMINAARDLEKSTKIVTLIENRLAEVQDPEQD